jgi:hypothetical protein
MLRPWFSVFQQSERVEELDGSGAFTMNHHLTTTLLFLGVDHCRAAIPLNVFPPEDAGRVRHPTSLLGLGHAAACVNVNGG